MFVKPLVVLCSLWDNLKGAAKYFAPFSEKKNSNKNCCVEGAQTTSMPNFGHGADFQHFSTKKGFWNLNSLEKINSWDFLEKEPKSEVTSVYFFEIFKWTKKVLLYEKRTIYAQKCLHWTLCRHLRQLNIKSQE